MINPNSDDFVEDEPLSASLPSGEEEIESSARRSLRQTARKVSAAAGDTWEQTKAKAGNARERTEFFLRENPVPTILGALAIGLAIGLAIRYSSTAEEREIKVKPALGNIHWSFLSLPFLWPFFKSVKDKYEDSAEAMKENADRLKNIDIRRYTKPIRKRWKAWTN